ncbi:MAG: response regulator transcription factor [Balneola sp.]|jgi:DNA-binding NarL/FixJ family response regulator|nr:response regulator transcription factor [Balneola sp.]
MNKKTKILLADDHSLIRNGLVQVLVNNSELEIIEAENGKQALSLIQSEKPEIAILDIEMPEISGFEVAEKVKYQGLAIDLIFLTMLNDETMFNKAMDIGVKGYVLKENTVNEIVNCIETVLKGNYYLSPSLSGYLIRRNNKSTLSATDKRGLHLLTVSEKKILKLVAEMMTSQEIAEELNISIKTVQNHRSNICTKLDLSGTHALLKYAMEVSNKM